MVTKEKIEQQGFITAKLSTGTLYIAEKYKVFINNKKMVRIQKYIPKIMMNGYHQMKE